MLDVLRRNAGSWAIKIILTFIALTFVIWGVGSYTEKDRTWAARIGKEEITTAELAEAEALLQKNFSESYGSAVTPEMAKALKLKEQALNSLVNRALMRAEARKLGLTASDVEVQRDIASNPAFQVNGQFSETQYRRTLEYSRLTTTAYEAAKREEITLRKMDGLLASAARVTEAEARDLYDLSSRKIRLLVVAADPDRTKVPETASDAEIAAKYEQAKESLRIPARVRLLIARFDPAVFAGASEPTAEEIRTYYDGNTDKFRTEESRLVAQVLVPVRGKDKAAALGKAEAIMAEGARGKAEFAAAARKNGAGSPGELWATRKALRPEIADAVFSAPADQAVGPFDVQGGYLIVRVNQIRFPETQPLSQVRDRVIALARREKGSEEAVKKVYAAHAKALATKDLKAACAPYGIVPTETGWITSGKSAEIPPPLVKDAVDLPVKDIGPVKTVGDDNYLFQVTAKEETRLPAPSEVRETLRAAVVKDRKRAAAQAAIETALAGAKSAADLERNAKRAALSVSTTPFFSPVTEPPPAPLGAAGDIRRDLLALGAKSPLAPRVYPAGPRVLAFAFDGDQGADRNAWEARKAAMIAALVDRKKAEITEAFLAEWRKAAKVEINPEVIAR